MRKLSFGFFDDSGQPRESRILMFYSFETDQSLARSGILHYHVAERRFVGPRHDAELTEAASRSWRRAAGCGLPRHSRASRAPLSRAAEAGRVAITRFIKRGCKVWIRVFPDKPVTHKPAETRMGKGKGAPDGWVCVIKPGRILYEVDGVDAATATEALRLARHKFGFPTRIVARRK